MRKWARKKKKILKTKMNLKNSVFTQLLLANTAKKSTVVVVIKTSEYSCLILSMFIRSLYRLESFFFPVVVCSLAGR